MPVEQLTYPQIAERLGVSVEAARALVRRHRLPRSRSNDGKTLVAVDLEEVRHKPMPARAPRGDAAATDVVAALTARLEALQSELAAEQRRSAGHRDEYERERVRADDLVALHARLVTELEMLRVDVRTTRPVVRLATGRTRRLWYWLRPAG
jgi:hypothetical protein